MPQQDLLKTDCAQCAALCCMALAFDKGKDFAFDKNPGEPCRNLSGHLCSIHNGLAQAGLQGCVAYDCLGAGNRVVQEVFAGRSWQEDARLTRPMIEAFAAMREVHKRLDLLRAAGFGALEPDEEETRKELLDQLETHRWTGEDLNDFEVGTALEIDIFLHRISAHLPDGALQQLTI